MTEIRIYFEGDSALKPGFHAFFREIIERARNKRCRFELISTGARPLEDFNTALKTHPKAWNILLRDSDCPDDGSLFEKCRLNDSLRESAFWMVQIMESWFLADLDALESFYGTGFNAHALRRNPRVEEIAKADLYKCLNTATSETKKGAYHKTKHAPKLLELITPSKVRIAAPNCERLFKIALSKL